MSTPSTPQYGIKSCGKRAEKPFEESLGPCLLEPGHSGKCKFKAPFLDGTITVERVEKLPSFDEALSAHPWYSDAEVMKWRRSARRLFWGSMAAFTLNVGVTVWTLLRLFEILP